MEAKLSGAGGELVSEGAGGGLTLVDDAEDEAVILGTRERDAQEKCCDHQQRGSEAAHELMLITSTITGKSLVFGGGGIFETQEGEPTSTTERYSDGTLRIGVSSSCCHPVVFLYNVFSQFRCIVCCSRCLLVDLEEELQASRADGVEVASHSKKNLVEFFRRPHRRCGVGVGAPVGVESQGASARFRDFVFKLPGARWDVRSQRVRDRLALGYNANAEALDACGCWRRTQQKQRDM